MANSGSGACGGTNSQFFIESQTAAVSAVASAASAGAVAQACAHALLIDLLHSLHGKYTMRKKQRRGTIERILFH